MELIGSFTYNGTDTHQYYEIISSTSFKDWKLPRIYDTIGYDDEYIIQDIKNYLEMLDPNLFWNYIVSTSNNLCDYVTILNHMSPIDCEFKLWEGYYGFFPIKWGRWKNEGN